MDFSALVIANTVVQGTAFLIYSCLYVPVIYFPILAVQIDPFCYCFFVVDIEAEACFWLCIQ